MKVSLRDLPSHQSISLGSDAVRAALAPLPMRAALERPQDDPDAGRLAAELDLHVDDTNNVFVTGTVNGWVEVACGRCLGTTRIEIEDQISASYLPREQVPADPTDDDEIEVTEDDVDVFPYDEQDIDLEPMLREQLILAVPYTPLCQPACKGLCSVCGADLNTQPCQCDRDVIDPRLAALRDIKI